MLQSVVRLMFARPALLAFAILLALHGNRSSTGQEAEKPSFTAAQVEFFEKQVEPILKNRCLKCHGGEEKIRGGLRMTNRPALLRGGDLGPAAKPGDPEGSALISAIEYRELEMPPSGKIPAEEIAILRRWVQDGLPWSANGLVDEPVHETPGERRGGVVDDEARRYWAYQPIRRPTPPTIQDPAWATNPIDAFIAAKLDAAGLVPSPPADPTTLVRRLYYDLTGLPPTPAQLDEFVRDPSPAAYDKLIDRLLDSPQYGEKWGRHWLDLVRYAETNGYERDNPKPEAWRYRDYVIRSFHTDKPYDVFLREQLAGDELDEVTLETLTATGYYRLGIWDDEPADRPLAKYDVLDGIVSTTGQVMLGMSIGCARCHEHKRDPILHRDYYRLLAFFRDVTDMNGKNTRLIADAQQRAAYERQLAEKAASEARLYGEMYQLQQAFLAAYRAARPGDAGQFAASDLTELQYRFYRDTWDALPDFASLKAETEGQVASGFLSLAPASRRQAIGLVFEGTIKVPHDGEYAFDVEASEGVRLTIGGREIVDRPQKGRHRETAKTQLAAGLLPFKLEYFNSTAEPVLRLGWTGVDGVRRPLTDEASSTSGSALRADSREKGRPWQYTTESPRADWMQPDYSTEGWKRGPGGFGTPGTPGAVVRTPWRESDIWLRTTVRLDRVPSRVALDLHHDEDVEVYLNGKLVYSAKGFLTKYQRVALGNEALEALHTGDNLLAVHCRQTGGGQYIDVGLVEGSVADDLATLLREEGPRVWDAKQVQRYAEVSRQLEESRKTKIPEPGVEVMSVSESGRADTHVLLRGNPGAPGEKVAPGPPTVLVDADHLTIEPAQLRGDAAKASSGKRRALADWIASPANPLTARVMANRLWQYHLGRGIVPTPNDFGLLGEQPTHPELLDWLASELRDGGWKLKRMHKLILQSSTYRMSSVGNAAALAKDPANHLWWRYPMRRLSAEEIRDSMLAVSGQINLATGGPSVYPPIPAEVLAGQSRPGAGWGRATPEEAARRSVYVHVKRSLLLPILSDNDAADTDNSCPVRYTTTVPTQSLSMLNGEFSNEQALALSRRLKRDRPNDLRAQVEWGVRLVAGRTPSTEETTADLKLIEELQSRHGLKPDDALQQFCLLLLNTNAFVYLD